MLIRDRFTRPSGLTRMITDWLIILGVLDNLRRLSVDNLEDDGSGMSDSETLLSDPESLPHIPAPQYQELTLLPDGQDWENSVASSDQMESLGDDDMNTMDM